VADKFPWRALYYVLEGHEPVQVADVVEWGRWFGSVDRQVAFTDLGFCTVSTVFLGLDHRHFGDGPPLLFETMVFANKGAGEGFPDELDGRMNRYSTWDEAEAGHAEMVAEVRRDFWRKEANGK
jgi:hypothetical protein